MRGDAVPPSQAAAGRGPRGWREPADRTKLTNRLYAARKPFAIRLFGREFKTRVSDLLAGGTFTVMGVFTLFWAANQPMAYSAAAVDINIFVTQVLAALNGAIGGIPQFVWAIAVIGLFAWLAALAVKQSKENENN